MDNCAIENLIETRAKAKVIFLSPYSHVPSTSWTSDSEFKRMIPRQLALRGHSFVTASLTNLGKALPLMYHMSFLSGRSRSFSGLLGHLN